MDVVDGLVEDVLVTRILFVLTDEIDGDTEAVIVFDVDIEPLLVDIDVPDFEFVVVFVAVFEPVDVFELDMDPEKEDDPLELLDDLLDNVPLGELVKTVETVEVPVNLLNTDGTDLGVAVPVGVRVIKEERDPLDVSVLFGEAVELLLFFDDAVSVTV